MPKLKIRGSEYSTEEEHPDEGLIMAYIDGELDEEGCRYVEGLLLRSAEAREIADMMQSSSALLKSAFPDEPEPGESPVREQPVEQASTRRPLDVPVSARRRI